MLSTLAPEDALRATSRAGKLPDVVHLVLEGTDVNARDSRGMTPLLFAVTGEHPEIVRFLLEHGADVNARFLLPGASVESIGGCETCSYPSRALVRVMGTGSSAGCFRSLSRVT